MWKRIRLAEQWAASAWRRLDLAPPVDLDKVRKSLRLRLRIRLLPDDQAGGLAATPKSVYILVNGAHPPERQRFTIAHEIGEHLLIQYQERTGRHLIEGPAKERWCDRFAVHLLMPAGLVRAQAQELGHQLGPGDKTAVLAACFGVSVQAMTRRLWELGVNKRRRHMYHVDELIGIYAHAEAYAEQILAEVIAKLQTEYGKT